MAPTAQTLINVALSHYGQAAPLNTCVSLGAFPWCVEAGIPMERVSYSAAQVAAAIGPGYGGPKSVMANVTGFVTYAKYHGWEIVSPANAQPGDFMIWKNYDHISLFVNRVSGGLIRTVGAGGPTGKVYQQPQGGGGNPASNFILAVRPPFAALAAQEAAAQAAAQAAASAAEKARQAAAAKAAEEARARAESERLAAEAAAAQASVAAQIEADRLAAEAAAETARLEAERVEAERRAQEVADAADQLEKEAQSFEPPTLTTAQVEAAQAALREILAGSGKVNVKLPMERFIRTGVPIAVGAGLTWLSTRFPGIGDFWNGLDPEIQLGVFASATGATQFVYYWIVSLIGKRFPKVEAFLLGSSNKPDYRNNGT